MGIFLGLVGNARADLAKSSDGWFSFCKAAGAISGLSEGFLAVC